MSRCFLAVRFGVGIVDDHLNLRPTERVADSRSLVEQPQTVMADLDLEAVPDTSAALLEREKAVLGQSLLAREPLQHVCWHRVTRHRSFLVVGHPPIFGVVLACALHDAVLDPALLRDRAVRATRQ